MSSLLSMYDAFVGTPRTPQKPALLHRPVVSTGTNTAVTSRLSNDQEGVCPYCSKTMKRTQAAGNSVYICEKDRYVAPIANANLEA